MLLQQTHLKIILFVLLLMMRKMMKVEMIILTMPLLMLIMAMMVGRMSEDDFAHRLLLDRPNLFTVLPLWPSGVTRIC